MADVAPVTDEPEVQSEKETLKHLGFVEEGIQQVAGYASKVYDYAKENAGTLKPGVETIETTVKTYGGPAYDTLNGVLKFADNKVAQLDSVLPPSVKETAKSLSTTVVSDVKNVGVVETVKELLIKMEPTVEDYASSAWKTISDLPLVAKLAAAIAPLATYITEKYNGTVQQTADEGYKVSSYLPLVPTDKLGRIFSTSTKEDEEVPGGLGGEEATEVP
uniref:Small rubber particle protein SRPP4 n=1 Tax=Taraxacum brevicorniculatum TaxID=1262544 RepID=M9PNN3_9ASTR|nr:small rubber particle protein SRPP4 [Taraxacum brevicorniculatum]